ncbi:MAG: undecaprenyldiphospho-muramoylpentapeptide beta-N-acetylglucosaminyltransferase [Acidimicrobiia bacterium]|nr:undecaprenyldiphospho-muramoylpentapeptide beta-N-acetylglucosaminyltransferase [Acidimicrobiia bacterium]MCY4434817.1 undecaprenyldiphospho-muramoylpentapeptide beta-N-acetylglucosaminyltransferase [bacterium]
MNRRARRGELDGQSPESDCRQVWAVIAGGGTAGHVHPGLAVARALVRRGHESETIHFVGSARGVERDLVPAAGFGLTLLPGRGIKRQLTWQNVASAWGLARAVAEAIGLLRRLQPAVVLGLGGYASIPCALAARLLRIPVVVAEQNAVPGLANRLAGRWARACAVSFPGTKLPRSVLTGNPVREEVQRVDRERGRSVARAALGVDDRRRLVVVASGSLGAARINRAAFEAARHWADRDDLAVHHVVGRRDWQELSQLRPDLSQSSLHYRAVEYEEDMPGAYAAADLVVGRAGASSVAELAVVGLASVLVPLPGAPGDHQTANAAHLAAVGGAVMVSDAEMDGPRMVAEVDNLLKVPGLLAAMGREAADLGCRDADHRVAELLEEHGRSPQHGRRRKQQ